MTLRDVLNLMMRIPHLCHPNDVVAEINTCFHPGNRDVSRAFEIAQAHTPKNLRKYLYYIGTEFFDRGWHHMFILHKSAPDHPPEVADCYTVPCLLPFERMPTVYISVCYKAKVGHIHQRARVTPRSGKVYIGVPHVDMLMSDLDPATNHQVRDLKTNWNL